MIWLFYTNDPHIPVLYQKAENEGIDGTWGGSSVHVTLYSKAGDFIPW